LQELNSQTQPTPTSEATQPTKTMSRTGYFLMEMLQTLLLALVLYLLIDAVVGRVRVDNISMKPTLQPGEFMLVNKLAYRFGDVEHGDVVVFHDPFTPGKDLVKRVVGVPGDVVVVSGGVVTVNGQQLVEPYIADPPDYEGEWKVPDNSIFVLGDNRKNSSDSHSWGFVPMENLVGRAILVYFPLADFKVLNHPLMVVNADN